MLWLNKSMNDERGDGESGLGLAAPIRLPLPEFDTYQQNWGVPTDASAHQMVDGKPTEAGRDQRR